MKISRVLAAFLAACLASLPVGAEGILSGSLIVSRSADAGPVTPRVLSVGNDGERYAALPNRMYLILPPAGSAIPQPAVERTGAGTYRYRYAPPQGTVSKTDRALAAAIRDFESTDGKTAVTVKLEKGTKRVFGEYDRDEAKRLFILANEEREAAGLPGLSWDPALAEAARMRAAELSLKQSHGRPDGTQYSTAAENLAAENYLCGYASADIAAARMMELPGRKENILEKRFIKAGAAAFTTDQRSYWVLEFGK